MLVDQVEHVALHQGLIELKGEIVFRSVHSKQIQAIALLIFNQTTLSQPTDTDSLEALTTF